MDGERSAQLQALIQKLVAAVHNEVTQGPAIHAVIESLRMQGYSTMLFLEASLEITSAEEGDSEPLTDAEAFWKDRNFLQSLHIAPDDPKGQTEQ